MSVPIKQTAACPRCQADIKLAAGYCWKCGGGRLSVASDHTEIVLAALADQHPSDINATSFSISTLLLITTLVAVCVALTAAAPGMGIMIAILTLPPAIRTLMVVRRRQSQGREVPTATKIGLYLGSFGVTIVVTYVTLFVSVVAFCLSCLGAFVFADQLNLLKSSNSEEIAFGIAAIFTLAIVALLGWMFSKWIRNRWRKDTSEF